MSSERYSDLAVVSSLLGVNAVLSFVQEHRAAGVVETLRRRYHHSFMESAGGLGTFFIVVYILLRIAKSEEEFKEAGKGT